MLSVDDKLPFKTEEGSNHVTETFIKRYETKSVVPASYQPVVRAAVQHSSQALSTSGRQKVLLFPRQ
jgi:hypothetical protein